MQMYTNKADEKKNTAFFLSYVLHIIPDFKTYQHRIVLLIVAACIALLIVVTLTGKRLEKRKTILFSSLTIWEYTRCFNGRSLLLP